MSDSDSVCSEASLGETIGIVEDCLSRLCDIEREKYIVFSPPAETEVDRQVLWSKYGIHEQVCTEDLAELLHRLAEADRDKPWFTWLKWVLFGQV